MKVRYDPEEIDDNLFIEFGEKGEIMGTEIWQEFHLGNLKGIS